jgi:hypothetical protein
MIPADPRSSVDTNEDGGIVRIDGSVTSLSWIPSESIQGATRVAFDGGFTHYDRPPPDEIDDLEGLQKSDRFRFANLLSAWAEFDRSGRVTDCGYSGGGLMGSTTVALGGLHHQFTAVALPDLQISVEKGKGWARFIQTTGGRTGLPAPRRVRRPPYIQWQAPLCWSTLSLTLHTAEAPEFELIGASHFPRHWIYDHKGRVTAKTGLVDFDYWYRNSFGERTPWGDQESQALVTAAETALERRLSVDLMRRGRERTFLSVDAGEALVAEGEQSTDVFLVLDGVIRIERGGQPLVEYGPGAVLGERSGLQDGRRTSTLVAVTPCRIAAVPYAVMNPDRLRDLSTTHGMTGPSA